MGFFDKLMRIAEDGEIAKPCPLCGSVAEVKKGRYGYRVECEKVGCLALPSDIGTAFTDPRHAVVEWNNRPEIARLQQENSDLKDAIKAINAGKLDETLIEEKDREIYDLQRRVGELENVVKSAIAFLSHGDDTKAGKLACAVLQKVMENK